MFNTCDASIFKRKMKKKEIYTIATLKNIASKLSDPTSSLLLEENKE
jgi:hypothetical protein